MKISKWKLKAFVQKGISFFPYPTHLNYLFQRHITKGVQLTDEYFAYKIQHAKDHIEYFTKYSNPNSNKLIVELGTGWYPIIPIFMYLTNSGKVISIDIQNWMSKKTQIVSIKKIKEWKEDKRLNKYFYILDTDKWKLLENILSAPSNYTKADINELIGLKTIIKDARQTGLDSKSVDYICSNNTFEHIYYDTLIEILKEFKRIIKPHGVMSHFIDMSDHFAHFDKNITIYNFLQYSQKNWNLIDNKIQPQNRLRLKDYISLYNSLKIPITNQKIWDGEMKALDTINLDDTYSNYSKQELAISHAYLISQIN